MAQVGTLGARFGMIRDSQCWDRRTLKRGALHHKKLGGKDQNFRDRAKTAAESAQYLDKFHGEMTHIWQGRAGGLACRITRPNTRSSRQANRADCSEPPSV